MLIMIDNIDKIIAKIANSILNSSLLLYVQTVIIKSIPFIAIFYTYDKMNGFVKILHNDEEYYLHMTNIQWRY